MDTRYPKLWGGGGNRPKRPAEVSEMTQNSRQNLKIVFITSTMDTVPSFLASVRTKSVRVNSADTIDVNIARGLTYFFLVGFPAKNLNNPSLSFLCFLCLDGAALRISTLSGGRGARCRPPGAQPGGTGIPSAGGRRPAGGTRTPGIGGGIC